MTSIYQRALGSNFDRLHPQIQRRFGFSSTDHVASVGRGIMSRVGHGAPYTLPFLYRGARRRIMFPDRGTNIPFTIQNCVFVDPFGRETVTWIRTFEFRRRRCFDAYMIYGERRGYIIDYLGSHEHLAVDLKLSVDDRGGLCLCSSAPRFYEGLIGVQVPLVFSSVAKVCEWYDAALGKFCIDVNVHNDTWGRSSAIAARSMSNGWKLRIRRPKYRLNATTSASSGWRVLCHCTDAREIETAYVQRER